MLERRRNAESAAAAKRTPLDPVFVERARIRASGSGTCAGRSSVPPCASCSTRGPRARERRRASSGWPTGCRRQVSTRRSTTGSATTRYDVAIFLGYDHALEEARAANPAHPRRSVRPQAVEAGVDRRRPAGGLPARQLGRAARGRSSASTATCTCSSCSPSCPAQRRDARASATHSWSATTATASTSRRWSRTGVTARRSRRSAASEPSSSWAVYNVAGDAAAVPDGRLARRAVSCLTRHVQWSAARRC